MIKMLALFLMVFCCRVAAAEDGYRLWLRYAPLTGQPGAVAKQVLSRVYVADGPSSGVIRDELLLAAKGMTGDACRFAGVASGNLSLIIIPGSASYAARLLPETERLKLGEEGFLIRRERGRVWIVANSPAGLLYGTFHLLRVLQTDGLPAGQEIVSVPRNRLRLLNHWDNLDRTVERGYAGFSIWNWHTLPHLINRRYVDYARANASIGINGTVLTNVNANATILSTVYLQKVKALADVFRPYGIRVYLTARFSAPIESGGLKTADPLNEEVKRWWKNKADEIYRLIPDFGGFLVKANSEGQPGPQDYGRNHADGANMLADAVAPYGGVVMWRAFVYSPRSSDRFRQAYEEFQPLDGKFRSNVLLQIKNGPIDFQPREPFSPLFGSLVKTPVVMEFQLTQEYLGQATHLVYLAPMFKEVLQADTHAKGKGSTVQQVIDGSLHGHRLNGMAGVSNIGNDINWTGHPFAQANWYALGRMSWDSGATSESIAQEWIRQTFTRERKAEQVILSIMLSSHEALVNYMTPLGLGHIMYNDHHHGPMPWGNTLSRPDWNPVYYHRADSAGLGFDRTGKGSKALEQYRTEVRAVFENRATCPEKYLLWFHHIGWKEVLSNGNTLWEELCRLYYAGTETARRFGLRWEEVRPYIDRDRFGEVEQLLRLQHREAVWWRNACVLYFQTFSRLPIPDRYEKPDKTLEEYMRRKDGE